MGEGNCLFVSPWKNPGTEPLFVTYNNNAFSYFIDGIPKSVPVRGYVSVRERFYLDILGLTVMQLITQFIPNTSGTVGQRSPVMNSFADSPSGC